MSKNLDIWSKKYGVKRIGLFGSYSRGEQRESSDIDVFIDYVMTFDNYMELKFSLEDHFQKPVDLVIVDDIKPTLKPTILRSAKYAEGS